MTESPASVTDDALSEAGHIARLVSLVLFTKGRRFQYPLLSLLLALLLALLILLTVIPGDVLLPCGSYTIILYIYTLAIWHAGMNPH